MTSNQSQQKDVTIVLARLKDIAEAVILASEAGTLKQVLRQIAYVAQQLVNCRYAALGIPDEHKLMKYFEVVGMTAEEIQLIDHPPIGRGLLGAILQDREILRLEHMRDHPRSIGFPANHPHMDRFLGVPIQIGEQLFGMLYLCDRLDNQPFTESDQWLVESLAGYAALAITGSKLKEQHGRLMLLEERERVGMELHDGIIQSLYAIGMQLQLLQLEQPDMRMDISKATKNLDVVIEDIRHYIMNLKVANYEQSTLYESLMDVVARLQGGGAINIKVNAPNRQPPFAPPVLEAVSQIAYEAVSNIIRHAEATEALIDVTESPKQFKMVIWDNGKGFNQQVLKEHDGLGLRNMLQRARIYGGDLILDNPPSGGARLTLLLPITS